MAYDEYSRTTVDDPLVVEPAGLVVDQQVVAQPVPVVAQQVPVVAQPVPVVAQQVTAQPVTRGRVATSYGRRYAFDSFVVGVIGLALTIVGLIAMARAGLDGPMNQPVVSVIGFNHTATLGVLEAAIGICLLISAAATSRSAATFFGIVLGIGGVVGAVQTDSFKGNLALESGLAWLAVIAAIIVVVVSLVMPRKVTRVDRVEDF